MDMINIIFEEFSDEDWLNNLGLTTKDGTLITASKPDSMDLTALKKISDMLCFEKNLKKRRVLEIG